MVQMTAEGQEAALRCHFAVSPSRPFHVWKEAFPILYAVGSLSVCKYSFCVTIKQNGFIEWGDARVRTFYFDGGPRFSR